MKKTFTLFLMLAAASCYSQTYLPLTDNMAIPANSWIKITPGSYQVHDNGQDGVIQLNNVHDVIIDGDSVTADGLDTTGYLIKINNSYNLILRNFDLAKRYYYAVYATNSHNIEVYNNTFLHNKTDSSTWIDVWADYTDALGGGAMLYNCDSTRFYNNIMKLQNDGIALYHCANAEIHDNDLSWNTSFGLRMYFTDSCHIYSNNCSHVNKPHLDPSDCAALLMIIANENLVENNDLSYSGDGVFLGQYQYSQIPNNNVFLYNECSGSPHNAIEATFADGNIYKHNLCDRSQYGLWLGYSFNSIVDSNSIQYNQVSGISIDRGFSNVISNNTIRGNPNGIAMWEGSPPASGYSGQSSHDYQITGNVFEGNTEAISSSATEHLVCSQNQFLRNYNGVRLEGVSSQDSLVQNLFDRSTFYDIQNNSSYDIQAPGNTFSINDTSYIKEKIYDHNDNTLKGYVYWHPYTGLAAPVWVTVPPAELTEPPSVWYDYTEATWWLGNPVPISIVWDYSDTKMGEASLHLTTGTGWYNGLNYRPVGDTIARWDLSNYGYLGFWLKGVNTNQGAFQYFHVRVGNRTGGYFRYNSNGSALNQCLNTWKYYTVPLFGGSGWSRQTVGTVTLQDINYVEVYTDTYGVGYDLWMDGLQFLLAVGDEEASAGNFNLDSYPNPFTGITTIHYQLPENSPVTLQVFDISGKQVRTLVSETQAAGSYTVGFNGSSLEGGVYFCRLQAGKYTAINKLIILK